MRRQLLLAMVPLCATTRDALGFDPLPLDDDDPLRIVRVLDDEHGFVRVVDVMGDDRRIVAAARVTYSSTAAEARTAAQDRALIRYLMAHEHTSPTEMCELTVHVRAPLAIVKQWQRHRTGSYNEVSARYTQLPPDRCYVPPPRWIAPQSSDNHQGRQESSPASPYDAARIAGAMDRVNQTCADTYKRLADGDQVALEVARFVQPQSLYTEFWYKTDLHNLLHFLRLRLAPNAQLEIRRYAQALAMIVAAWVPVTWRAFCDHRLNAVALSANDARVLRCWLRGETVDAERAQREFDVGARAYRRLVDEFTLPPQSS